MPRVGGEAAKLGDYYEGIWTVDSLLDLLSGQAASLQVEPFAKDEAEGIEFIKINSEGGSEYHSAKRQKPGEAWSIKDLARAKPNGRSILGDLFGKLTRDRAARSFFVSQTGANEVLELCDRAGRCSTSADLAAHLAETKHLAEDLQNYILPLCEMKTEVALECLRRLRVISFEEQELIKRVSQKTMQLVSRLDGDEVDANGTRRLLAEFILSRLGQKLGKTDVLAELERNGLYLCIWAENKTVLSAVGSLNESYLVPIRSQLINKKSIPRKEAGEAFQRLTVPAGRKAQLLVGSAGMGKSCVMAETVQLLIAGGVHTICFRLDNLPHVLSTENLGRELGLPRSPAVLLAGIAHGGMCAIVIDQLDALSLVSGRSDHLWPVFHLLLAEADRVPNMRVLLACRAFDLHHDARLRALTGDGALAETIKLALLEVEQVYEAVREAGGEPKRLINSQVELLRTPFNLQLFLQGDPANYSSFRSVKDLFDRFWEVKSTLAAAPAWDQCIVTLARALSQGASSAPEDLLDQYAEDAKKIASHGVLLLENRRWRFFHETFGDYAFARQFAREGQDLVKFLTEGGEQHLYRRSQVRQILAYERDRDRETYVRTLRRLMGESKIRLHIKKLAFEWLSQLNDPTNEEWQLLEGFLHEGPLGPHSFAVLWESVSWFDLLHSIGAWPQLLAEDHNQLGEHCARMLSMDVVRRERSAIIAGLFSPHRRNPKWDHRFRQLFNFGRVDHSREMFDLVLGCMDDGLFDDPGRHSDTLFHQLSIHRPDYAVEFIGRYLDRLGALARARNESNPFRKPKYNPNLRDFDIRSISEKEPLIFTMQIAPRLERLILANALPGKDPNVADTIWPKLILGVEHELDDAILFSTARALRKLASDNPSALQKLIGHWEKLPHATIRFLLLSAWAGNAPQFAEVAAQYLTGNPSALDIGYLMVVGDGDPGAGVSRELLSAISPLCSDESHANLERAICSRTPIGSGDEIKSSRVIEIRLLKCLKPERLRAETIGRLKLLESELPGLEFPLPHGQPIGFREMKPAALDFPKLADEEWLEAFKECSQEGGSMSWNGCRVTGYELIVPLNRQAMAERERFARLIKRMPDSVSPVYFSTILECLTAKEDSAQKGQPELPLDLGIVCDVIARVHSLPNHPCGRAICSVVDTIVDKKVGERMVEILGYYALHDPDPTPEGYEGKGKDLVNNAINTIRGRAADALARILFAQPELSPTVLPFLEKIAQDRSASIRAVTIFPLVALLNRDRDSAVKLFCGICGDPHIWASHHVEEFLYYATFTHYTTLRPLMRQMLGSDDEEAKSVAAGQICMAAFRHAEAEPELDIVLAGDSTCRKAAARIYGQNHHHPSIRLKCEKHLLPLLNDSNAEVRQSAEFWLSELSVVASAGDWNFFGQYLESVAFAEEPGACLHELQEIPTIPPVVVLRLADRAIELSKRDSGGEPARAFRFAHYTPTLVVRLYHQAEDVLLKTRCLDLLDAMLALGWNEAALEMAKADR